MTPDAERSSALERLLWSDTGRLRRLAVAGTLMLGLGLYNVHVAMEVVFGYRDCLEDPERWDGSRVIFPLWTVTGIDGPERYRVSKVVHDVPVAGTSAGLQVGDTISIKGHFRASDLAVVEETRALHPLRRWKERLGYAGLVVVLVAAPGFFTWRGGRLRVRGGDPNTSVPRG